MTTQPRSQDNLRHGSGLARLGYHLNGVENQNTKNMNVEHRTPNIERRMFSFWILKPKLTGCSKVLRYKACELMKNKQQSRH